MKLLLIYQPNAAALEAVDPAQHTFGGCARLQGVTNGDGPCRPAACTARLPRASRQTMSC